MEVKKALQKRRSVRKFTREPVPEEAIHELLHAAMSGPSACNRTPWEFFVVTSAASFPCISAVKIDWSFAR